MEGGCENNEKTFETYCRKHALTVIEMATVLSQIEAIMNSRPLTPISDDLRDLEALIPGYQDTF